MTRRVLLIDDDPVFASLVVAIGKDYGLEVDAHESLSVLGTVAFLGRYDAALLDFHLPEVNGFEIAEYYDRFFSKIPVIMVSAGTLDPEMAWPPCVNHLLCKSSGVMAIVQSVCDIIDQNQRQRAQRPDMPPSQRRVGSPTMQSEQATSFDKQHTRYFPA